MKKIYVVHLLDGKRVYVKSLLKILREFDDCEIILDSWLMTGHGVEKSIEGVKVRLLPPTDRLITAVSGLYAGSNVFVVTSNFEESKKVVRLYLGEFPTENVYDSLEEFLLNGGFILFGHYLFDDIDFHPMLFFTDAALLRLLEEHASELGRFEVLDYHDDVGGYVDKFYR